MSFTVYRSSAGSGKTFTLVKEYLKLILLEPGDFRHILAITFTNKAANEMKDRILKSLEELAKGNLSADRGVTGTLLPMLAAETGMAETEIKLSAGRALEMILHNYADFAIGTIDSFSHKLIRTFAHDFGLPVNFNVELDNDELLSTAVDLLLDRVGDDLELTGLLVNFLETRMDEDKGWNIDTILSGFAKILLDEEGQRNIPTIRHITIENFRKISAGLYATIGQFEKGIRELGQEATASIQRSAIPPNAFYRGDKGIGKYFHNLAAGRMDKLEPNAYVVTTIEEDKWFSAKATPEAKACIDAIKPILLDTFEKVRNACDSGMSGYMLRKLLAKTIYPLAVLNEIGQVLDNFKRQNNLVHISEFNARIAGIVLNEPVPFIYERLGEKYRHLFIDEFQDTSALQWMNYIPLVENALAGGYFNLVVGDGKQAIYRWRGGDVEQFTTLPEVPGSSGNPVLKQREESLQRHFNGVNLDRNYRSRAEIVDFNNRFFRIIAGKVLNDGKERIYDGLEQIYDPEKRGGFISLEYFGKEDAGTDGEDATLKRLFEITGEAVKDGYRLNDMAILCRSNRNASRIARFLLENGIGVLSAESLLVTNSTKVRFIIACMKYLFEPKNDIVIAEIEQFLKDYPVHNFHKELDQEEFSPLPVYDLCEALVRRFELNTGPDAYLQFFLDAVLKYAVKISAGTEGFLEWWEKNREKVSIIVPEGIDAVRVMTIHKAKGLQFPLVILPYALDTRKNTRTYLWVDLEKSVVPGLDTAILRTDKEMEATVYKDMFTDEQQKSMLDLVNLLYVAMTRPEERLYILSKSPSAEKEVPDSWPAFFDYFLKTENLWEEGRNCYRFGLQMEHVPKTDQAKLDVVELNCLVNSDWRKKIRIKLRAPLAWDPEEPATRHQWGNRIHTVLSWVRNASDIEPAVGRACRTGLIANADREHVEQILRSVVGDARLERYFSEQVTVKTEAEILLHEGAFYRPDRVIFDGDLVTIVDYKSGAPRPEHADQLTRYAGYIGEMGYANIRKILVYLDPEIKVAEV